MPGGLIMQLRAWQAECISKAVNQFITRHSHYLCLATPGAGKTRMASILAKQLFDEGLIDIIICITPSIIVSDDFREELEIQMKRKLDGKLGSIGQTLTYQAMITESDIWELFESHNVFVIFDEIHHCAGSELKNANAWGGKIISEIQGKAAYTLALTGTPWRSDNIPIALSSYCEHGLVHCDYSYGLPQAIADNVCRVPNITLIDNDKITLNESGKRTSYKSFRDLLTRSDCSYQSLVENEDLIKYTLGQANQKLDSLRKRFPDAGGLIVASSVIHANNISRLLKHHYNEESDIATYLEEDALKTIRDYKYSSRKWIISVGMISEGTNIPRLRVCCHLTRVKTELYFRQILGRILRADGANTSTGYIYIPAEPTLIEYSHRVAEDIPQNNIVQFNVSPVGNQEINHTPCHSEIDAWESDLELRLRQKGASTEPEPQSFTPSLSQTYESTLDVFGQFKQRILTLDGITAE
jgi:superfamily II DNA or RNA helicase